MRTFTIINLTAIAKRCRLAADRTDYSLFISGGTDGAIPVINLLVVIARPDEEHDVGYDTIAHPLIEVIQNSQLPVNVDLR